jgi:hypothetical protein
MDLQKESQLTFEDFRQRVSVVNVRLATVLRNAFISRFVDTESPQYQDHIATSELVSEVAAPWAAGQNWDPVDERDDAGNIYYWGYLWDFFIVRRRITEEEVESRLRDENSVYAMWDIHSPRKIKGYDNYWRFPVPAILNLKGRDLL